MKLNNTPSSISGSIWFDPQVSRLVYTYAGAWSTGGNLIFGDRSFPMVGSATCALKVGGNNNVNCAEIYNGTSWSSAPASNESKAYGSGLGTANLALMISSGGSTELFNGISWSNYAYNPGPSCFTSAAGTVTNGLVAGGALGSNGGSTSVLSFSCIGSSQIGGFSTGGATINSTDDRTATGTQNSTLSQGFDNNTYLNCTEEYNGSSWSSGGAVINSCVALRPITGTQNAGLLAGGGFDFGSFACVSCTEEYNGTSWSAGGSTITTFRDRVGAGSQNATFTAGGFDEAGSFSQVTCTEEYNGTSWSTGGALITGQSLGVSAGTQNAGLFATGCNPSFSLGTCTEEYNGTSWSTGGAVNSGRFNAGGGGSQNSAFIAGGNGETINSPAEDYNGTSWSTQSTLITARICAGGAGDNNSAGIVMGGLEFETFNSSTCTEEYGQITLPGVFCTQPSLNQPKLYSYLSGTQNAASILGGVEGASTNCSFNYLSYTEEYNGTSWSSTSHIIYPRACSAGAGASQNAGMIFGGQVPSTPSKLPLTEKYDGTSWSIGDSMIIARIFGGGTGTSSEALSAGGDTDIGNTVTFTEEYSTQNTNTCVLFDDYESPYVR